MAAKAYCFVDKNERHERWLLGPEGCPPPGLSGQLKTLVAECRENVLRDILVRREDFRSPERLQKMFKRYWGEARAQPRKAFLAWLLANGGVEIAE